ncbi:MAG: biotin transporter BioY [Syntrophomonadaceae bacterium]|nr:biotin transporter BioY [Syntrophomonadaceae bacterium]
MKISTREMVWAAMFTALLCVLTILVRMVQPIIIIPFSLQPLVMLLAACLLSPPAAFLSMLAYLCLGLMGLPVFSVPPYGGPAYILLPSFGFLLAFPFAAWLQSKLIRKNNLTNFILAGTLGVMVYYMLGLPYMYLILNFYLGHTVDVIKVIKLGFLPFIALDILKIILASFIALQVSRRLNLKREVVS